MKRVSSFKNTFVFYRVYKFVPRCKLQIRWVLKKRRKKRNWMVFFTIVISFFLQSIFFVFLREKKQNQTFFPIFLSRTKHVRSKFFRNLVCKSLDRQYPFTGLSNLQTTPLYFILHNIVTYRQA